MRIVVGSIELDQRTGGSLLAGGLAYRLFLWLLPFGLFSSALLGMLSDAGDRSVSSVARDLGMSAAMRASISEAAGATDSGQVLVSPTRGDLDARLGTRCVEGASPGFGAGVGCSFAACRILVESRAWLHSHPHRRGRLPLPFASPLPRGLVGDVWATAVVVAGLCALGVWVCLRLPHAASARWFDMVPEALIVAVGLEGLRLFTAVFLATRLSSANDLYGAVGLGAAFMAFLYIVARCMIGGLAINAEFWRQRNDR